MDLKRRKAIKYGLLAGIVVAAMCSFPLAASLLTYVVVPYEYFQGSAYPLIVMFTMLTGNLMLVCAPLSLPVATVPGIMAIRSARAGIASLSDATAVNIAASLLMALAGAFGAFLVIAAAVIISSGLGGYFLAFLLFGAPAFAMVLFTISFFGGLVYSVYSLKLTNRPQSPGQ